MNISNKVSFSTLPRSFVVDNSSESSEDEETVDLKVAIKPEKGRKVASSKPKCFTREEDPATNQGPSLSAADKKKLKKQRQKAKAQAESKNKLNELLNEIEQLNLKNNLSQANCKIREALKCNPAGAEINRNRFETKQD